MVLKMLTTSLKIVCLENNPPNKTYEEYIEYLGCGAKTVKSQLDRKEKCQIKSSI